MHKIVLHSAMILSSMVIAYYGIQSMHSHGDMKQNVATHVVGDVQIESDNRAASLERRLMLNKKLMANYENEARDFQKLGLSADSRPVKFAEDKMNEAAAEIRELERELSNQ